MTPETDSTPAPPIDADVLCARCGYNLRTLPPESVCPECAHPVRESLRPRRLLHADLRWLRTVRWGVRLAMVAYVAELLSRGSADRGIAGFLSIVAVMLATRGEPGILHQTHAGKRWAARLMTSFVWAFAVIPDWLFLRFGAPMVAFVGLLIVLQAGGWISLILWLRTLCLRAEARWTTHLAAFCLAGHGLASIAILELVPYLLSAGSPVGRAVGAIVSDPHVARTLQLNGMFLILLNLAFLFRVRGLLSAAIGMTEALERRGSGQSVTPDA